MQLLYPCKWGKKPGLIGPISVDMKKEYGDAEGQKNVQVQNMVCIVGT